MSLPIECVDDVYQSHLIASPTDLLVALVKSFESWLVWISLMGMFVLGWIGKASNKYNGNAKLASEKVSLYVMAYSVTVIGGIALIWLESIQVVFLVVNRFCLFSESLMLLFLIFAHFQCAENGARLTCSHVLHFSSARRARPRDDIGSILLSHV